MWPVIHVIQSYSCWDSENCAGNISFQLADTHEVQQTHCLLHAHFIG